MRKAQTSLGGILILIIGATLLINYLTGPDPVLELEKQSYLKQYNQMLLLNTLDYRDKENITVKELLAAHACGRNVEIPVKEIMDEMMKPGYDYVFQANELVYYSSQPRVSIEEIYPARIDLNTDCGNITIIAGAYYE